MENKLEAIILNDPMEQDVVICRCEEITEQEIRDAIRFGARTIDAVKRLTRAGMGLCQGRTCSLLVARLIVDETGISFNELTPPRKRFPIRPLELNLLAQQDVND